MSFNGEGGLTLDWSIRVVYLVRNAIAICYHQSFVSWLSWISNYDFPFREIVQYYADRIERIHYFAMNLDDLWIKTRLNKMNPRKFPEFIETNKELSIYLLSLVIQSIIFIGSLMLDLLDDSREYFFPFMIVKESSDKCFSL